MVIPEDADGHIDLADLREHRGQPGSRDRRDDRRVPVRGQASNLQASQRERGRRGIGDAAGIPHHGAGPACRQAPGPPLSVRVSVSRPAISAR